MTSRRLWLIDAGYMYRGQSVHSRDYSIDYVKLRNKLEVDEPLWRAYYLNSVPSPTPDSQVAFYNWMRSAPPMGPKIITKLYELRASEINELYCEHCRRKVPISCPNDRSHRLSREQQKGVDVGLATLALTHIENYDTLILSSGDSDLLDAIEYITEKNKRFELLVFKSGVSTDLQCRADRIWWIDDFSQEVAREF
ncbi:MAG: NYN domain-containing protein [Solidesulfovibrio sp.]